MASMDIGHDGAIFSEKDVKELSENLSKVFCNFVNTKIGDVPVLKKYIENYKALLQLPIFFEMQTEIDRLKQDLENNENEEHIKLEVEETVDYYGGGDSEELGENVDTVTDGENDEVEVNPENDGGDVPNTKIEVEDEEVLEGETDEEVVEEEEEIDDEEEVVEEEEEIDDEEEVVEEEEEIDDEEEVVEEETDEEEEVVEEEEEVVEEEEEVVEEETDEEEEMYEWLDEESGNTYYTNDPDGESGDIYECLEDEEIGEHIGTITNGEISLF
jgi:flagellar biosynthesis GTPase FlhF